MTNCVACNPENNVIKPAIALSSNATYTDSHAYLQSRCKTYIQKSIIDKKSGVQYIEDHKALYPNNNVNGPQTFETNCYSGDKAGTCQTTTIYKPSNRSFAHQGAVASGTRIAKLKTNTITMNGNSFTTAMGAKGANAGRYQGTSDGPYFIKNRPEPCLAAIYHRKGNPTACFPTPVADMVKQSPWIKLGNMGTVSKNRSLRT